VRTQLVGDRLAIYKHSRGVELVTTEKQLQLVASSKGGLMKNGMAPVNGGTIQEVIYSHSYFVTILF